MKLPQMEQLMSDFDWQHLQIPRFLAFELEAALLEDPTEDVAGDGNTVGVSANEAVEDDAVHI